MKANKVLGLGRTCEKCHIQPGKQEECVEIDGKIYHAHHNPLKEPRQMYLPFNQNIVAVNLWLQTAIVS